MDPLGALRQELEVRIGMDVQNVYEFSLQKGANVHPFFVNLLHSIFRREGQAFVVNIRKLLMKSKQKSMSRIFRID